MCKIISFSLDSWQMLMAMLVRVILSRGIILIVAKSICNLFKRLFIVEVLKLPFKK